MGILPGTQPNLSRFDPFRRSDQQLYELPIAALLHGGDVHGRAEGTDAGRVRVLPLPECRAAHVLPRRGPALRQAGRNEKVRQLRVLQRAVLQPTGRAV